MNEIPNIIKLEEVAKVIPMPLSVGSRELLGRAAKEYVYLDNSKKDAVIMSRDDILSRDSKAKAFVLVAKESCMMQYLVYLLNTIPNNRFIDKKREKRSLSTSVINQLNIPMVSVDAQRDIVMLVDIYQKLKARADWDIYSELGAMCLEEISIAVNTELFLNELCVENNIHILDRWSNLIHHMPQDVMIDMIPRTLLATGNSFMAEVRALQRILVHAHKDMQDGI